MHRLENHKDKLFASHDLKGNDNRDRIITIHNPFQKVGMSVYKDQ